MKPSARVQARDCLPTMASFVWCETADEKPALGTPNAPGFWSMVVEVRAQHARLARRHFTGAMIDSGEPSHDERKNGRRYR